VTAAGLFQAQVPVFGLTLLATLLAGWLLIPLWGLLGAAAAIGAGFLISLTLLLILFFRNAKN
jgi:O-antigen/teichoic acid export membrane protein